MSRSFRTPLLCKTALTIVPMHNIHVLFQTIRSPETNMIPPIVESCKAPTATKDCLVPLDLYVVMFSHNQTSDAKIGIKNGTTK